MKNSGAPTSNTSSSSWNNDLMSSAVERPIRKLINNSLSPSTPTSMQKVEDTALRVCVQNGWSFELFYENIGEVGSVSSPHHAF